MKPTINYIAFEADFQGMHWTAEVHYHSDWPECSQWEVWGLTDAGGAVWISGFPNGAGCGISIELRTFLENAAKAILRKETLPPGITNARILA